MFIILSQFLVLIKSDACLLEIDYSPCYCSLNSNGDATLSCSRQSLSHILNVNLNYSRISLVNDNSNLFESSEFKPVLKHLADIVKATIDIGASKSM